MRNKNIVKITEKKVPTIISYDPDQKKNVIGDNARFYGLDGQTNIFNFKLDFGLSDTEFSKKKKYWYYIPDQNNSHKIETFTAKEAAIIFLEELLRDVPLPEQVMVGVPGIRDDNWRENFREHMREVFAEMGFGLEPKFFPEPFAVFQYYRSYEEKFLKRDNSETVLIIDVGAGTFNTCVIRTNVDGSLSRGGATSLPLGLNSELFGGAFLDLEILRFLVKKTGKGGTYAKEDPIKRIEDSSSNILLAVEDLKIKLSKKFPSDASLIDDFTYISEDILFKKGTLHQEKEISTSLNGNEFKEIIRSTWRKHWGKIIIGTINEAKAKLKKTSVKFTKIDKVLVAGGSSNLPFMVEEIVTVLPTQVGPSDVYIGSDPGSAVALGLACECREQVRRDPKLSVGKVAPCLMTDVYFALKKERHGDFYIPKIKLNNQNISNGHIISSPFETEELNLEFDLEMPFAPGEKLYFYYSHSPLKSSMEPACINFTDDVITLPNKGKIVKKARLELDIKPNGKMTPKFYFKVKGGADRKDEVCIECNEIYFDEFDLKDNESFVGIDFGTANSYVSRFISESEEVTPFKYPDFKIDKSSMGTLRVLEAEVISLLEDGTLSRDAVLDLAKDQKLHMIFHSNKIEGSPLTKGETAEVLESHDKKNLSKSQMEAQNLENAFDWAIENLDSCDQEPEAFFRQLNKLILVNIHEKYGEYRKGPVKISGVDFVPPDSGSVPSFMKQLSDEITKGKNDRSIIELATCIHTKFVFIHPFEDGNGRTARLFMNAVLWKHGLPGVIVNYFEKERYLGALEASNNGDLSPLLNYFVECLTPEIDILKEKHASKRDSSVSTEENTYKESTSGIRQSINIPKGKFDSLLKSVTKAKEKLIDETNNEFEEWQRSFDEVLVCFENAVDVLNNFEDSKKIGLQVTLKKYGMIDLDKYIDLCQFRRVSQTWYFTFHIRSNKHEQKFLLYFVPASKYILNHKNVSKVGLVVLRHNGERYVKLKNEPISIAEIYEKHDKFITFDVKKNSTIHDCNSLAENILVEIINEYFS